MTDAKSVEKVETALTEYGLRLVGNFITQEIVDITKAKLSLREREERLEKIRSCSHREVIFKGGSINTEFECSSCKFTWYD